MDVKFVEDCKTIYNEGVLLPFSEKEVRELFSHRQKEIILGLSKVNEIVTSDWIAKNLGISDRTVRSEIKNVQKESAQYGISIESIRGKGYQLKIDNEQLYKTYFNQWTKEMKGESVDFSNPKDRVLYLLKRLLLEQIEIKLEVIEDEMFVSKSTIQNDLKEVKTILGKYNLQLVNRPHYGVYVEGEEYMKRLCLSNNILNRNQDFTIKDESFQVIDQTIFEEIKEIIIKKVIKYKIEISDIALENLATHISIACLRIKEGFVIAKFDQLWEKEYPFEKIVATEIVKNVEEVTDLTFPEAEVDYIIVHLLGTKLLAKDKLSKYSGYDHVAKIIETILEKLKSDFNWDLKDDFEFIQALTLHIRPAMNRLRYGLNIRNPLLDEIKIKYPVAFEGAVLAGKCIEDYLSKDVGEHEIGYIALHIGAALERRKSRQENVKRALIVCASGVGSSKLLYYKLKNIFRNELDIVGTTNYYQLKKYDFNSIDLIISTIPINEDLGLPVQVVNTFIDENDIEEIKSHLVFDKCNEEGSFLSPDRIFIHQELNDRESVIHFMCDQLSKQRVVPEDYEKLVTERELLAPTSFGNLVAIPHPLTPVTEETFLTICTLKRPIYWSNNQMVQFVCLLNISKGPKGELDHMYQTLISIMEDKTAVEGLIKSHSRKEIMKIMNL